jgi:hypothetical protein
MKMGRMVIEDPRTGDGAHVDANYHLHVESVNRDEKDQAAKFGWKFNINTGDITITNTTKITALYVKNTGDHDMVVNALIYNLGNTTNGTGDVLIEVKRNPTAGSIITNANNVAVGAGQEANQNFQSTNTMTGLFYVGAQGETAVSGGDGVSISTRSAANTGRILIGLGAMEIPKGAAFSVDYTPPASNTSQTIQIAAAVHIKHPDVAAP